jgi:hypothetical protein
MKTLRISHRVRGFRLRRTGEPNFKGPIKKIGPLYLERISCHIGHTYSKARRQEDFILGKHLILKGALNVIMSMGTLKFVHQAPCPCLINRRGRSDKDPSFKNKIISNSANL